MGRFDGVLLISDFDNTLVYTCEAFANDTPMPPIPARNLEAIRYFMDEGGLFTIATGRGVAAIRPFVHMVPTNVPAIVDNGGGIYDFAAGQYVRCALLPREAMEELEEVMAISGDIAAEIYYDDGTVAAVRPNHWTENHSRLARIDHKQIPSMGAAEANVTKVCLMADDPMPIRLQEILTERGASDRYDLVLSNANLLEVTCKGANKGVMLGQLAELCGVEREHVCCAGDHANDLTMLRAAAHAFAPANAIDAVKQASFVTLVCHCCDGALADVVAHLKALYPEK